MDTQEEACPKCGYVTKIGDFPFCKGSPSDHVQGHYGVIGDDIPGGIDIRHGLCHPDGTPRRFYSKSEMHKFAADHGFVNRVEHTTPEGSDKSPHTRRWF